MKTYKYIINGESYEVVIKSVGEQISEVEVNGVEYRVENVEAPAKPKPVVRPKAPVSQPSVSSAPATPQRSASPAGAGSITSPLPGVILDVKVKEGDAVKKGQCLMVLEAMKMENSIEADRDGKVVSIKVKQGDSVMEGDTLVSIGE